MTPCASLGYGQKHHQREMCDLYTHKEVFPLKSTIDPSLNSPLAMGVPGETTVDEN